MTELVFTSNALTIYIIEDKPCELLEGTCQFASADDCNGGFLNGFCATPNHKCCKPCKYRK